MNSRINGINQWVSLSLILIACALMLVSFIRPWWVGTFIGGGSVEIYGWGLRHNLVDLANYVVEHVTPTWQIVLAWIYVGASIILAISSHWIKKRWGSALLGIIGSGLIAYAVVAMRTVVEPRLETFQIPLQGFSMIAGMIGINTEIQSGYYFSFIAGGVMVVLALWRYILVQREMRE